MNEEFDFENRIVNSSYIPAEDEYDSSHILANSYGVDYPACCSRNDSLFHLIC